MCDCGATIRVEHGQIVGEWHTCSTCTPKFYAPAEMRHEITTYTRPAARERELLPSEMSVGALIDLRNEITSRIAAYRQPGVPVRFEDRVALEAVMAEIEERESRAAVTKW